MSNPPFGPPGGQPFGQGPPGPGQPFQPPPGGQVPGGGYGYGYGYGAYPAPGYVMAVGPVDHPQASTVLVLGILSLVLGLACGVGAIMGPIAWVMGNKVIQEIDANPTAYTNRGNAQAGRVCGIIATVLLACGLIYIAVAVANA